MLSGYRSADRQFGIWQGKFRKGRGGFPQYYEETKAARRRLPGGEFGDRAVTMLAETIAGNVAAPGYSNHQDGLALDLGTRKLDPASPQGKRHLIKVYYGSWFHNWLKEGRDLRLPPAAGERAMALGVPAPADPRRG